MSTSVEQIKERLSIEDVVSSYVKLERAGKNLKAKCPFHNEKTPSFYISPDRGTYYCFGCGAKGDIFSFVQQFEGLDFPGALKLLAERAGVVLRYDKNAASSAEAKSEKEKLYAIMEDATVFFQKWLAGGSEGSGSQMAVKAAEVKEAQDYLKKRGLKPETVKEFRVGFVPDDWRLLYNHLHIKGWSDTDIEKAGLAKRPDAGDAELKASSTNAAIASGGTPAPKALYDRFRGRVMFPIGDSSGRIIAFSGRILHDDGKSAKYLNSPDTPLYTKSTVLYGLDKAKGAIRGKGYTIFVEGQMDLVLSHQAGIKNTVAVSGTALADTTITKDTVVNNLGIVRRLSSNVIFAFDSDAAGRKAAMRSAQIALALDMDVKIATMTEGKDPADMILADLDLWRNALRTAKPVIEFLIDGVLEEKTAKKFDDRKLAPMLVERVYPFIAALTSQTTQALYVKMIRDRIFANSVTEGFIWDDIRDVRRKIQADLVKAQTAANHHSATNSFDKSSTVYGASSGEAGTGQLHSQNGIVSGTATGSRLDIISRKLFGLLAYLAREKTLDTDGFYTAIKTVAGDERYNNLIHEVTPSLDELTLEAELFFGSDEGKPQTAEQLHKIVDEMLLNFEEDIVKEDFAAAMADLTRLEKVSVRDDAVIAAAQSAIERCQTLSKRLADISKKREVSVSLV